MKHEFINMPMAIETTMFASQEEGFKGALNDSNIIVDANYNTTKSVCVTLRYKRMGVKVNQNVNGFKTKYEKGYSYVTGTTQEAYYFKILKSQGIHELKTYVETIIKQIYQNYNVSEEFTCKWYKTKLIKNLL